MAFSLVVGLGNPGPEYACTRHNAGFLVLDLLAERYGRPAWKKQKQAQMAAVTIPGAGRVWLCKPQTFMNLSGEAVAAVSGFYQIPRTDLLVVCDDFALPLGKLRLRTQGSSGGHNGLTSIVLYLGSDSFCRLRVGIGPVPPRWDPADFVLGRFDPAEEKLLSEVLEKAADAVVCAIQEGFEKAMNRFNALDLRPPPPETAPAP